MTGEPSIDRKTSGGKTGDGFPVPERTALRRPALRAMIILAYLAVFWALLPALLFATGFRLDRLLPISLGDSAIRSILGWSLILSGFLLIADSTVRLWLRGKGLPISHLPPSEFVTGGAYRYLRHPIYAGYTAAFAGAGLLLNSFWSLAFSAPLLVIGWVTYAKFYEEPVLARRFGARYAAYVNATALLLPIGLTRRLGRVRQVHPSASSRSSWQARQMRGAGDSDRAFFIQRGLMLYFLWVVCFESLGRYAATLPTHDLTCRLDDAIPLIPIFIWPYVFCYLFALLPGFVSTDWHRVCRGVLSVLMANFTSFVIYLAYPVAFPKPEPGATLSERLIRLEYVIDFHPGANNFPSLHVIFAWLTYFICLKQGLRKITEWAICLAAVFITVSTVFVKQHILADVIAGVAWAAASWHIAGILYVRWRLRDGDAKAAFNTMLRRLMPFFAATILLMALFAIPR